MERTGQEKKHHSIRHICSDLHCGSLNGIPSKQHSQLIKPKCFHSGELIKTQGYVCQQHQIREPIKGLHAQVRILFIISCTNRASPSCHTQPWLAGQSYSRWIITLGLVTNASYNSPSDKSINGRQCVQFTLLLLILGILQFQIRLSCQPIARYHGNQQKLIKSLNFFCLNFHPRGFSIRKELADVQTTLCTYTLPHPPIHILCISAQKLNL